MRSSIRCVGLALMLSLAPLPAAAEEFTNAIHAFLERHLAVQGHNGGIVVGIVDEHGGRVVSCGQLDNGTGGEVNGDTLFELGSITKTFTALLLQDMIERGEMKLDDPAGKYFPRSVKMPAHNGKPITLRHLVSHTSGLPFFPTNLHPQRVDNPYAGYTVGPSVATRRNVPFAPAPVGSSHTAAFWPLLRDEDPQAGATPELQSGRLQHRLGSRGQGC